MTDQGASAASSQSGLAERIIAASRQDNEELLREALKEEGGIAAVNKRNSAGSTALHYAAEFGAFGCLCTLLNVQGIALETRDTMHRETALMRCVKSQRLNAELRLRCLAALIHAGASAEVRDGSNRLAEELLPAEESEARSLLQQARLAKRLGAGDIVDDDDDDDDDDESASSDDE
ncbi:hypothetical protein THASP1DRAFT_22548 [Thamnocephalis sphaerospora]|uniref:Uncharacterized protein n=1 Tax=Thamnocephalis sphaerospora TaxID=78915 RepID=A0A4P9XTW1_9FUNG|nr:hypothetical protein THASP1DRAFT_22548 [Thamnocephalis sphaerospora]|eukprot:RKP09628.1 hypothetical protein THASP1DRAFT_22548 [Thamnocephalis sphaerospora]